MAISQTSGLQVSNLIHIVTAPFASFFMMLLWAGLFGETFTHNVNEKNMFEEYIICIQMYFFIVILYKLKKMQIK